MSRQAECGEERGVRGSVWTFYFHVPRSFLIHTAIMFYAIGLGLADEKDVSVKGLEIIKRAERVYLEAYTAVLLVEKEVLVCNSFDRILRTLTNRNRSRKLTMAVK
jgi:hypothetical protein